MSRIGLAALLAFLVLSSSCKKAEETPTAPAGKGTTAPAGVPGADTGTAARAPGTIKVDKTAGQDGPLTGDSADDGVITLSIEGPITSLAVVSVDSSGAVTGEHHWDTVVEQQPIPAGWKTDAKHGADTWQLGVEENGKPLNAKNGALTPLGPGPHKLMLYVGDAGQFTPGNHCRVLAERPDHRIVKSNIFSM